LVINMPRSAAIPALSSEFDAFLFAPIGEDRNGMALSVVSALGRMDLDPWREAATLAGLPAETAAQKLASLLDPLYSVSSKLGELHATATRLIALLPRKAHREPYLPKIAENAGASHDPSVHVRTILFALYMILMLGTQFMLARRDPPQHADAVHAPAPRNVALQIPPAVSDR
jgi:hypothetical protein